VTYLVFALAFFGAGWATAVSVWPVPARYGPRVVGTLMVRVRTRRDLTMWEKAHVCDLYGDVFHDDALCARRAQAIEQAREWTKSVAAEVQGRAP
jgi:hypothetical protein